mmetsp:Transcript_16495/g.23065  ORF Transcript_16495/g.23065 Transcript_16495/m.23065 type:complete len:184 (-) Transcript_16495:110-661(-)|eukprot:CAMPEP_0184488516 /NCGR_PEP_ID=MMETSP0113_2-20130426/12340_1 /TAXON_ID=91329 /ORGANISM="Norrisiella sphaerica, Strain BC52" /LENGTH=183 /DNA_ID=CAMNT_0026871361 /DNA_START=32 /DNA_END=583 /DNA_ORIENTATION=+
MSEDGNNQGFHYEKWLSTLRPGDQKALKEYFDGETPEMEDMTLLVKAEMSSSGMKPLTLNRIWKAIQSLKGSGEGEVNSEAVKALKAKLEDTEHKLRIAKAEKEKIYSQVSQLQRMYAELVQQNESLKNQLRQAGAQRDGKQDVWIPSKAPPPNMLPGNAGDNGGGVSRSSKFYRPDRSSAHV